MKHPLWEPLGVTAGVLVFLKGADLFLPPNWISVLVPVSLLYVPLGILIYRRKPIFFLDRSWRQTQKGCLSFLLWVALVFPPYLLAAHFWMTHVFGFEQFRPAPLQAFTENLWYQLLVVALPEEFYFRGYLQTMLKDFFKPRWKIFGATLGWEWLLTALIFAFAHSIIGLKWWHFSIFFPALLFGYLREKTGSITAPILFHAFSNCWMNWFAKSYF